MSSGIKVVLGVLGGALLVVVVLLVFGGGSFFGPSPMIGQGGWGAWWILGMLVPLLFLGGLTR